MHSHQFFFILHTIIPIDVRRSKLAKKRATDALVTETKNKKNLKILSTSKHKYSETQMPETSDFPVIRVIRYIHLVYNILKSR